MGMTNVVQARGVKEAFQTTGTKIGNAAKWFGHKVQSGYSNYLVPTIQKVWNATKTGAKHTLNFLKTGHGAAFLLASLAVGVVTVGHTQAQDEKSEDGTIIKNHKPKRITAYVSGLLLGLGAALSLYFIGSKNVSSLFTKAV